MPGLLHDGAFGRARNRCCRGMSGPQAMPSILRWITGPFRIESGMTQPSGCLLWHSLAIGPLLSSINAEIASFEQRRKRVLKARKKKSKRERS
jgi:hypothetical protein